LNGRLIMESNQPKIEIINISMLKNGFYHLKLFSETGEITNHKILVQR